MIKDDDQLLQECPNAYPVPRNTTEINLCCTEIATRLTARYLDTARYDRGTNGRRLSSGKPPRLIPLYLYGAHSDFLMSMLIVNLHLFGARVNPLYGHRDSNSRVLLFD